MFPDLHMGARLYYQRPNVLQEAQPSQRDARRFVSLNIKLIQSRSLKVIKIVPLESLRKVSYSHHSNYCRILYCFGDIERHWSKIAIFSHSLHSTPPLEGSPSEYCHTV